MPYPSFTGNFKYKCTLSLSPIYSNTKIYLLFTDIPSVLPIFIISAFYKEIYKFFGL